MTPAPQPATPPRLAPAEPPFDPLVAATIERLRLPGAPPLALLATLARNPRVLSRIFAGGLLDTGSISLRARELMIMRTCALNEAGYEWGVHVAAFAAKAGLDRATCDAMATEGPGWPGWSAGDRLVLEMADALHTHADIPDPLWHRLADSFQPEQLIELIAVSGFYRMISQFCRALRLTPEAYAPGLPAA